MLSVSPFYTGHTGTPILNELMIFSAESLVYLIPLALLYLWFSISTDERKSESIFIFVTIVVSLTISYAMGQFYSHPAPYMQYETLISEAPENSFPSQHTTVVFAFAWSFLHQYRRVGLVALVLAALVGVSRVYIGVHYPLDIAGAVVAALVGFALVYVARDLVMTVADHCIRIENRLWTTLRRSS